MTPLCMRKLWTSVFKKKYGLDALEAEIPSNEDFSLENFLLFRNILPADISDFGKLSVTYIAGWVVRKLSEGKKPQIACEPCRHAMVDRSDSTNPEDYALVISKDRGGLIFPSQSVLKICFRSVLLLKSALGTVRDDVPIEKKFCAVLLSKVLTDLLQVPCKLFESLNDHMFDDAPGDPNHVYILSKIICKTYINLRMYATTKSVSAKKVGSKLRHNMTRQIIWAHQWCIQTERDVLKTTNIFN